jgi:transaldolase
MKVNGKVLMNIKIFADGANLDEIIELNKNDLIKGFTTNPTLMRASGITNYMDFAVTLTSLIKDKPISLEVFSDDFNEMYAQAIKLFKLGSNVYVKIPITNTLGESSGPLIKKLTDFNIKVNVTAIMTSNQVQNIIRYINPEVKSYISVFAGRIANTGVDPVPIMKKCVEIIEENNSNIELIWASPRELLNIYQAEEIGCHIITVTNSILNNMHLIDKDLKEYSLDTVKMFYNDAKASGYVI